MEKLYNDTQYAQMAIQANEQGKFLYRYQHEMEYEAEVLEWDTVEAEETRPVYDEEGNPVTHKETVENPIYDEEGNIIGYDDPIEIDVQDTETVTVEKLVPHMVEETYIDPETGEEVTVEVQGHHTETLTKMVEELMIAPQYQYLLIDDTNVTDGTVNPDYNEADMRKAKFEKEFFLIPAAAKVTKSVTIPAEEEGEEPTVEEQEVEVDVYYRRKPKGYSSAVESLLAAFTIATTAGKVDEGIIKVYAVPDFNDPEQVTEEWLIEHQISLPEMNAQQFMGFYSKFLVAWNTIEHEQ